jgi:hypothetical protein
MDEKKDLTPIEEISIKKKNIQFLLLHIKKKRPKQIFLHYSIHNRNSSINFIHIFNTTFKQLEHKRKQNEKHFNFFRFSSFYALIKIHKI